MWWQYDWGVLTCFEWCA